MKKEVIRKCIVTGESHNKKELLRVVKTPTGEIVVDKTGRVNGRGAYVVARRDAIKLARKKNSFGKVFEKEISEDIYLLLEELCLV